MSMGTFFDTSGAASKSDLILITLPSTQGDQPTRGVPGAPGPMGAPGGLILAAAALPAAINLDHSIFWSDWMSLEASPRSFMTKRVSSLCCSRVGILPPPPDWAEAR